MSIQNKVNLGLNPNKNMYELSDERIRNDEREIHYYDSSSTHIYICYRTCIDDRLKVLMLQIAEFCEQQYVLPDIVTSMLIEQYKSFWDAAEPACQKVYEDIQKTLALPKDFVPKAMTSPQYVFGDLSIIQKLEEEIRNVDDEYFEHAYYLKVLKQRKQVIEEICIPLKNQIDLASKLLKDNMRKSEHFEHLHAKMREKMDILLEGFDKKSLQEKFWRGAKSEAKQKDNMKHFMDLIEKNKNMGIDNV